MIHNHYLQLKIKSLNTLCLHLITVSLKLNIFLKSTNTAIGDHQEQNKAAYLIPLEQVVCDFGSVVARRL